MISGNANSARGRILVVDDDPALGEFLARVLRGGGRFDVTHVPDAATALQFLENSTWDLLITDIELPGMSGLELIERVEVLLPDLPVAMLTGHATVDRVVTALRYSAAEFLQKPITAPDLIKAATALVEAGWKARAAGRETVLAVGAHPDDVEIGAAGALIAHRAAGDTVAILTMSQGARGGDRDRRAHESAEAAEVIGATLFLHDLEDTRIPEGNPTIELIEQAIAQVQPTVVYTHSVHDVHQDHRNTHRAVMVASRRVGRVYCYQSPSATVDFRPTHFVAIDDYLDRKIKAIGMFGSQADIRDYLEPDLIASTARYWSRFCGASHAEAFETVRDRAGSSQPGHGLLAGAAPVMP